MLLPKLGKKWFLTATYATRMLDRTKTNQNMNILLALLCLTCLFLLKGIEFSIVPKCPPLSPVNKMTLSCLNHQDSSAIKGKHCNKKMQS